METILKINCKKEMIEAAKEVAISIKKGIWIYSKDWQKENKKSPNDMYEFRDAQIRDMQYIIGAMRSWTDLLNLTINIQRRIGWTVGTERLFNLVREDPTTFGTLKDLLNFYLSQPLEKKILIEEIGEKKDEILGLE